MEKEKTEREKIRKKRKRKREREMIRNGTILYLFIYFAVCVFYMYYSVPF